VTRRKRVRNLAWRVAGSVRVHEAQVSGTVVVANLEDLDEPDRVQLLVLSSDEAERLGNQLLWMARRARELDARAAAGRARWV
jgi:hypothetical protein